MTMPVLMRELFMSRMVTMPQGRESRSKPSVPLSHRSCYRECQQKRVWPMGIADYRGKMGLWHWYRGHCSGQYFVGAWIVEALGGVGAAGAFATAAAATKTIAIASFISAAAYATTGWAVSKWRGGSTALSEMFLINSAVSAGIGTFALAASAVGGILYTGFTAGWGAVTLTGVKAALDILGTAGLFATGADYALLAAGQQGTLFEKAMNVMSYLSYAGLLFPVAGMIKSAWQTVAKASFKETMAVAGAALKTTGSAMTAGFRNVSLRVLGAGEVAFGRTMVSLGARVGKIAWINAGKATVLAGH